MSAELIKKEGYNASLKFTVTFDEFDNYCNKAYNKEKSNIKLEGFRKGKAPRKLIEKMYGEGVFYEDALNFAFNDNYPKAIKDLELEVVSQPKIDINDINKGENVVFTVDVIVRPDFEIGTYKGLNIKREPLEVSDEEVESELNQRREKNARFISVENRAIKDGDTIKLDFLGKDENGVAFDGGTSEDYSLVVGSKSFIDGFEEQLVGMNLNEEKVISVKFPDNYHSKELAGKPATFDVKIKDIKEKQLPELDNDFAMDISEFDTLDELKEDIKKQISEKKEKDNLSRLQNQIVDKIIETSTFDLPKEMIDNQINMMLDDFSRSLSYQGMNLDMYLQMTGMQLDKMKEDMQPQAEKAVKSTMVIDKVTKLENINYSEEQIDEEIAIMSKNYGIELEKLKEMLREQDKEYLVDNLIVKNTLNFLVAENEAK